VSDGRGIERFREAWIVDKAELTVIQPDRPGCDRRLQDIAGHRDSGTCGHVKSIQAQEPRSKDCPFRGRRLQAFVHQSQFLVTDNILLGNFPKVPIAVNRFTACIHKVSLPFSGLITAASQPRRNDASKYKVFSTVTSCQQGEDARKTADFLRSAEPANFRPCDRQKTRCGIQRQKSS
jgi:hypothetical protein